MADADVTAALQVIASEAEQVGCEETPARQGGTGHNGNSKVRSDRVTRGVMKFWETGMDVSGLIGRLTGMGASISAEGDEVSVRFPLEHRREVEELAPAIWEVKPKLLMVLGDQTGRPHHELKDIELALKIGGFLARLPAHQSATACELAEAFHGLGYPLADMIAAYRVCEQLRQEQVLVRGRNGYGYRLSSWSCPATEVPGARAEALLHQFSWWPRRQPTGTRLETQRWQRILRL